MLVNKDAGLGAVDGESCGRKEGAEDVRETEEVTG